jgi:hypothetical protein
MRSDTALASPMPPRIPKTMAIIGCKMKRKRPGPVNRCGNSSRNCLENTHTRPVSMLSISANGIAMAITRSASAVKQHTGLPRSAPAFCHPVMRVFPAA